MIPEAAQQFQEKKARDLERALKEKEEQYRKAYRDLRKMEATQEENAVLSAEVEKAHSELDRERKLYSETIENMRIEHQTKENAMKADMKAQIESITVNAMDNAKKNLSEITKTMMNENAEMKETVIRLERKLRELTEENRRLSDKLADHRRQSALHAEEGQLYAQDKFRNDMLVCPTFFLSLPAIIIPSCSISLFQSKDLEEQVARLTAEKEQMSAYFERDRRALSHRAGMG